MTASKTARVFRVSVVLCLMYACMAPFALARQFITDGFRTKQTWPMTLALLPPHAEIIKSKALMSEQMVNECEGLENAGAAWLVERLTGAGYGVRELSVAEIQDDPELAGLAGRVNKRYDEVWSKMVRRPGKIRAARYNIGDDAQTLCSLLDVDGLLLSRIQAVGVTAGKKWLHGVLSLGQSVPQGYGRIDLAVVNGDTGVVEGYFNGLTYAGLKQIVNKPDKVMKAASKKCLRKYPDSETVLKPRGIEVEDQDEDDGEEINEEELMSDLEALLGDGGEEEEEGGEGGEGEGEEE